MIWQILGFYLCFFMQKSDSFYTVKAIKLQGKSYQITKREDSCKK